MDIFLVALGLVLAAISVLIGMAQLSRTPKPKSESESVAPIAHTSLMVIGVKMNHGADLPGHGS
ncbi:hypothetical protein WSK_3132 [Novosphingobium sp. Rr 2-17]|uniref:hypothetical protein n=1 Tax=Novosphingobium sp. Rr 2-17 TaxID=555793 RepID=UPI0002698229|nr:hypothetical protein [Novosphingobium sp. Rr 2-17]EIZ78250.1 hypothetical protein WSK_3132 [Novosphingobium sp. Rr 2-17]